MLYDKSKRRLSGGKRRPSRKKRKAFMKRYTLDCKLGDRSSKTVDVRGNNIKRRLKRTDTVNLTDPSSGKCETARIKDVIKTPANETLSRRNIIIKGAIIETDKGKAEVTSRPGQVGQLNARKIEE